MTSQSTVPSDDDEDTIEIELTPEDVRRLAPAGSQARTTNARYRLWPVPFAAALAGVVVGIAASIAWRHSPPRHVAPGSAPSPAIRRAPPAASRSAVLAEPQVTPIPQVSQVSQAMQGPPVRAGNPFDPQEVFEFPAGTTVAEARQKVSELLLQRAVRRRGRSQGIEPAD